MIVIAVQRVATTTAALRRNSRAAAAETEEKLRLVHEFLVLQASFFTFYVLPTDQPHRPTIQSRG